ncbi:MAG: RNA pyrophosphohydrolase [Porticoccaceae bacterium]|jgi:putative (di)nucleoside polyphosphate hydrolase|tara:strand:- start:65 stop:562 length:498 start_codon:yes stop_codon:yes gene_type:complete
MVDKDGFRSNVAIVISNGMGKLFWAKRLGQNAWQFPQGGVSQGETAEQTLYRELYEEVGLESKDVKIIQRSKKWLRYHIPPKMQRRHSKPLCIGQKQKWFYLELTGEASAVRFDTTDSPEFDGWEWVNYWYPIGSVVSFKRSVYRSALLEFAPANALFEQQSRGA